MTPIQQAQHEWEANTTPYPKNHLVLPVVRNNPIVHKDNFRKYGQAIAWLEWDGKYIEMKKFEKLPCAAKGAGTPLIEFLKSLADKYHVRILGNPLRYDPDPPVPCGPLLSQAQLEGWYEKQGFRIHKIPNSDIPIMWYPDAPPPKLS